MRRNCRFDAIVHLCSYTMSSPAKKRKLNADSSNAKPQSKGLEFFFSKQNAKQDGNLAGADAAEASTAELTDEELARKLQAEWDQEAASLGLTSTNEQPSNSQNDTAIPNAPEAEAPTAASASTASASKTSTVGDGTLKLEASGMEEDSVTTTIPMDESPLTFDPAKYIALLQPYWAKDGGRASYALLTRCFFLVSGTSSRIKIVDTLVNCIRMLIKGDPESLLPAVCWTSAVDSYKLTTTGLVGDEFNISGLCFHGAWTGRICHFQSAQECVWSR